MNFLLVIFIVPCLCIGYEGSVLFSFVFVLGKIQQILKIVHFCCISGLCGFACLLALDATHIDKLIPFLQVSMPQAGGTQPESLCFH